MIFKFFEVRDEFTRIPVMAVKFEPNRCQVCTTERDRDIENIFLYHGGFGDEQDHRRYMLLVSLADRRALTDPYKWEGGRTLKEAHLYIRKNFDQLDNGQVIDIEFILGEKGKPETPELYNRQ